METKEAPAADPEARSAGGHSRELEAARGIAILLVVFLHYPPYFFPREKLDAVLGPFAVLHWEGRTGVMLFFVLSAFLLSRPFLREAMGGARPSIGHFFERRVLRIVPLYWAAVLLAFVLERDGRAAIRSLFFLSDEGALLPWSGVWWSLHTEVQFYLLLGVSVMLLRVPIVRWLHLSLLAGLVAVYLAVTTQTAAPFGLRVDSVSAVALLSFAYQWPAFAFGGLAAWLHLRRGEAWQRAGASSRVLRNGGGDLLLWGALLLLFSLLTRLPRGYYFLAVQEHPNLPLLEGALWAVVVLGLLVLPLRSRRLFVNAPLEFVGRVSYSLYLLHLPFLHLTAWVRFRIRVALMGIGGRTTAESVIELVLVTLAAILVSWLSYRLIERPFLGWKNRIRRSAPAPF